MTRPGRRLIHHSVAMNVRPCATRRPHSGVGGGAPRPRKLSDATVRMALPISMVA
jgi:hypothetical protein